MKHIPMYYCGLRPSYRPDQKRKVVCHAGRPLASSFPTQLQYWRLKASVRFVNGIRQTSIVNTDKDASPDAKDERNGTRNAFAIGPILNNILFGPNFILLELASESPLKEPL